MWWFCVCPFTDFGVYSSIFSVGVGSWTTDLILGLSVRKRWLNWLVVLLGRLTVGSGGGFVGSVSMNVVSSMSTSMALFSIWTLSSSSSSELRDKSAWMSTISVCFIISVGILFRDFSFVSCLFIVGFGFDFSFSSGFFRIWLNGWA